MRKPFAADELEKGEGLKMEITKREDAVGVTNLPSAIRGKSRDLKVKKN